MALYIYSRIKPAVELAIFGYGVVTVGSYCVLDQGTESVNDRVSYFLVYERVMPSGLNPEDYWGVGVGDRVAGREYNVGNVVESR